MERGRHVVTMMQYTVHVGHIHVREQTSTYHCGFQLFFEPGQDCSLHHDGPLLTLTVSTRVVQNGRCCKIVAAIRSELPSSGSYSLVDQP